MRNASDTNYQETLREVGSRAGAAVEEIYDDLQNHIESVRSIPSDRRSSLAKQVQELHDICRMASVFAVIAAKRQTCGKAAVIPSAAENIEAT